MLTGSRFRDRVSAAGIKFVPLEGDADFDDRRIPEQRAEIARASPGPGPGPEQLNALFGASADALAAEHAQVQALLEAAPGAAPVTNSVFFGPWAVALGAPGLRPRNWVAVGCNPVTLPATPRHRSGRCHQGTARRRRRPTGARTPAWRPCSCPRGPASRER